MDTKEKERKVIPVGFDEDVLERLDRVTLLTGATRQGSIRVAVDHWLDFVEPNLLAAITTTENGHEKS